jgi:hypothetical protein
MAWRGVTIGVLMAIALAAPAVAGGPDPSADPSATSPPLILRPPPLAIDPPPERSPPPCLPALPCGTHLYGASQKNGTVGVMVPVMHW